MVEVRGELLELRGRIQQTPQRRLRPPHRRPRRLRPPHLALSPTQRLSPRVSPQARKFSSQRAAMTTQGPGAKTTPFGAYPGLRSSPLQDPPSVFNQELTAVEAQYKTSGAPSPRRSGSAESPDKARQLLMVATLDSRFHEVAILSFITWRFRTRLRMVSTATTAATSTTLKRAASLSSAT